jgi:hypothetical protein
MIHVKPPMAPFHDPAGKDWAHTDNQGATDRCVQGQVVLTDTTASLVASPCSHRIVSALTHFRRTHDINGDFCDRRAASAMVHEAGGRFQVPILAPKGSMIVFLSATLHSAKFLDGGLLPEPEPEPEPAAGSGDMREDVREEPLGSGGTDTVTDTDTGAGVGADPAPRLGFGPDVSSPWIGWRCVVYVAFRPREGLPQSHLDKLRFAFSRSVITRHGGDEIFPIKDIDKFPCPRFTPKITAQYLEWARTGLFPIPEHRQPLTDAVKVLLGE